MMFVNDNDDDYDEDDHDDDDDDDYNNGNENDSQWLCQDIIDLEACGFVYLMFLPCSYSSTSYESSTRNNVSFESLIPFSLAFG